MKINYSEILKKNMRNVFKEVLLDIETNGLKEGNHLYITFKTTNSKIKIPNWLKEKHPREMTIVIQYEYWNFKVKKNSFNIGLSFNNIKTDLDIPFDCVISFVDPYANFGLRLIQEEYISNSKKEKPNLNGKLQLVHGSKMFMSNPVFEIMPEVGNFYFFPNYLMHLVYPFSDTDEERRSISFNAHIDVEIYNVYGQ